MLFLVPTPLQEYLEISAFHKVVIGDPVMHACAKTFCSPESDKDDLETNGCKAMVSLFVVSQTDSLESLRCKFLSKKVVTAKSFVKPERLPPTTSAAKFHSWGSCSIDDGQKSGTRFVIENDRVQLLNWMYYKEM